METEAFSIFSFSSAHHAIAAETACSKIADARLIPVPPEISAGCGLALRAASADTGQVRTVFAASNIPYENVYRLTIKNKKRTVLKIEDDIF